jgi:hypothetical protein
MALPIYNLTLFHASIYTDAPASNHPLRAITEGVYREWELFDKVQYVINQDYGYVVNQGYGWLLIDQA